LIRRILRGAGIRSSYGTMGAGSVTLIEDEGKRLLVDVGHFGNRDQLRTALSKAGLEPREVDYVVLTHIHWDHCLNVDMFTSSEILTRDKEFNLGTLSGIRDVSTDSFKELLKRMRLKLISSDEFALTKNVRTIDTFGHAPGHVSLTVTEPSGLVVVSGDALPNLRALKRGLPDFVFHDETMARTSIGRIYSTSRDTWKLMRWT